MSLECTHLNPLQRDGTSQRKRMLEALKPDYIRVDEREIQDWILYAREYAKLLQFYNQQNVADGDWALFIEKDISTLVAMVSKTDTLAYKTRFEELVKSAEKSETQQQSGEAFAGILVILYEIAENLSDWMAGAVPELGLHKYLSRLIASKLDDAFAQLIVWLKKAEELSLPLEEQGMPAISLDRKSRSWPNAQAKIDIEAFPWGIPDRKKEVDREIFHLDRLFKRFFEVIHTTVSLAPKFLDETFTDYPQHQPHFALFLAFLNLMKVAQENMNTLTKRHLDFYYKEILQLKNRPEDPDEVHIIFELANNFESHRIEKNTDFDAGDDGVGEQLIYSSDDEIVVNKAVLDEEHGLKTIFLQIVDESQPLEIDHAPVRNIFAAPNADLLSPEGKEFKEKFGKWEFFGNQNMPDGEIGFAISSPMLLLGEGVRKIYIQLRFNNLQESLSRYGRSRIKSELKNNVKVYLSGEEDWVLVENKNVEIKTAGLKGLSPEDDINAFGEIVWELSLVPEDPPIINFSEEIHQRNLDTEYPVALFILDNQGLSTLEDLELNLAGGIASFEDTALYLNREIVREKEGNRIFQAQAEVIGKPLTATGALWDTADLSNVSPYDDKNSYIVGDIVAFNDQNFRANAGTDENNPIPPVDWSATDPGIPQKGTTNPDPVLTAPQNATKIWEPEPPSLTGFEPEKQYSLTASPGNTILVTYKDAIYETDNTVNAIAPYSSSAPFPGNSKLNPNYENVPIFPAGSPYSKNEIVFSSTDKKYYKLTVDGNQTGVPPNSAPTIWEKIESFNLSTPYFPSDLPNGKTHGDYASSGGQVFEALFEMTGVNVVDGPAQVWAIVPNYGGTTEYSAGLGQQVVHNGKVFTPAVGTFTGIVPSSVLELPFETTWVYDTGAPIENQIEFGAVGTYTHVELSGILYSCKITQVKGVIPGSIKNGWIGIPEFVPTNTYQKNSRVYFTNTTVTPNVTKVYNAKHTVTGAFNTDDWEEETLKEFDTTKNTRYEVDDVVSLVVSGNTLYFISEAITKGSLPNAANSDIWEVVPVTLTYSGTQVMEPSGGFFKESATSTRIYKILNKFSGIPLNQSTPLWTDLGIPADYNAAIEYNSGKLAKSGSVFYKALKTFKGYAPPGTGGLWKQISPTPKIWKEDNSYLVGQFVEYNGDFYLSLANTPGIGSEGWENVILDDPALVYDPEIRYNHGVYVTYPNGQSGSGEPYENSSGSAEVVYKVKVAGILPIDQLAPNLNIENWEKISSLDEFDSIVEYSAGKFVRSQGQIYKATAKTRGVAPGLGLHVWEPINIADIKTFDPKRFYKIGEYVKVLDTDNTTIYFRASAGMQGIAPSLRDSKNYWHKIPYYTYDSPAYSPGYRFSIAGEVYEAQQAAVQGNSQKPGPPSNTDWLRIDGIPAYVPGKLDYTVGDMVFHKGFYYELEQPLVADIEPGSTPNFWEELIQLQPYSGLESFIPGEYIEFKDKIYRPLVVIVGDDPLTSPDLWQEVGKIKEYSDTTTYQIGLHVKHNEQVFRALQTVVGLFPDSLDAGAYWQLVPGSYPYNYLLQAQLDRLEIAVDVSEMKNPILENDDGTIIAGKPFNPFGAVPKVGSKLYIGSHEIFQKSLKNISLRLEWAGVPVNGINEPDFVGHYANYDPDFLKVNSPSSTPDSEVDDNGYFEGIFNVLLDGRWQGRTSEPPILIQNGKFSLFEADNSTVELVDRTILNKSEQTFSKTYSLNFEQANFRRAPKLASFDGFRNGMPRGFMRLRLLQDFFHDEYPIFLSKAAIQAGSPNSPADDRFPKEPYTPLISDLTLSYSASEIITYKSKTVSEMEDRVERMFHIYPFGQKEFFPIIAESAEGPLVSLHIVPKFTGKKEIDDKGTLDEFLASGNLYLGIKDLDLPQNLNVLFQVAEGSENPDHDIQRITWSYLAKDRWIDFTESELVSDTSNGLLTSGIISFSLPKEMSSDNTTFPTGLYWIKASIVDHPDAVAKALAVLPQAVQASYRKEPGNDPLHLQNPLPPETISALIERKAGIAAVKQPFASFGGRLKEQDDEFYVRVSERLRHKSRGINIYDYERLVLQEFPQVYKAKCLNHSAGDIEIVAGKVKMVVVSDLRNKNAADKLRPILSVNTREEIKNYLQKKANNFTEIEVASPYFEEVRVTTNVEFKPGLDKGFYIQQLQKDIVRFMAPWLYDEEAELVFGNKLSSSALINYIEEQAYVEYLSDFILEHKPDPDENKDAVFKKVKDDEVIACTSSSVLVPAAEEEHQITPNINVKC